MLHINEIIQITVKNMLPDKIKHCCCCIVYILLLLLLKFHPFLLCIRGFC